MKYSSLMDSVKSNKKNKEIKDVSGNTLCKHGINVNYCSICLEERKYKKN